jgi:hypothetical protein
MQEESSVISESSAPSVARLLPAIIGALVGAIIGAIIWAVVGIVTNNELGLVAIVVGLLAGGGALVGAGMKRGISFQLVGVVMAVLGIVIGKYLLYYHFNTRALIAEYGQDVFNQTGITLLNGEVIQAFFTDFGSLIEGLDFLFFGLAILIAFGVPAPRKGKPKTVQAT